MLAIMHTIHFGGDLIAKLGNCYIDVKATPFLLGAKLHVDYKCDHCRKGI